MKISELMNLVRLDFNQQLPIAPVWNVVIVTTREVIEYRIFLN